MAFGPEYLSGWQSATLIGLFGLGLVAVLGYMLWYSRTLDDELDS